MKRTISGLVVVAILLVCGAALADAESDGRAAEQAGRYRDALNLYVQALKDKGGTDADLRERILRVAAQVSPPLAVPEEAHRFHVRAETAIMLAKNPDEFKIAVSEFQRAIAFAPWWTEAYYNLSVAQEGAGDFSASIASMKLYLAARANAADASQVRDRIYALEFRQEQAVKPAPQRKLEDINLTGVWEGRVLGGIDRQEICKTPGGLEIRNISGSAPTPWYFYRHVSGGRYDAISSQPALSQHVIASSENDLEMQIVCANPCDFPGISPGTRRDIYRRVR